MSDLGLAGGYNSNMVKEVAKYLKPEDEIIVIGNKGTSFSKKNKGRAEVLPIADLLEEPGVLDRITAFIKDKFYEDNKEVKIIYTEYHSQVEMTPVVKTILPIQQVELEEQESFNDGVVIEFEPEKSELLKQLENLYIQSFMVGAYRDSQASEHTSRKNAMDNASQNGEELLAKLDIEYNRGRQAKITQEISEIIGGAESLK